jgi:hypothetical protein
MIKKIKRFMHLLFFLNLTSSTYTSMNSSEIIKSKTRGSTRIQMGNYMTQEEFDIFKKRVLSFRYN